MLDIISVVHGEARRLCGDGRPHQDRWRERVLIESASELLPWFPSRGCEGMAAIGR